ncbi:MAG: sialidase family protein [Tahibacter sp.]
MQRWLATLLVAPSIALAQQAVTSGTGTDYQPSIVRATDQSLVLVFERLNTSAFGDLWITRSADDGENWSTPAPIIATTANERHPAFLQLGDNSFVLFYLKGTGATATYRLFRATSTDGVVFTEQGQIQLGWASGGEVNPHVIRHPDGTLTMSYQRLGGGSSHVAQSSDNGVTWDQLKTALASGISQLPRIAFRASDGRYLATYQVGSSPLALYAKTTTNVRDWSGPAIDFSVDGDNHDSLPIVMSDGAFVVFYIHANGSQYDVYSRRSTDAVNFENPLPQIESDDASDVEPHPLVGNSVGAIQLYWGREAPPGSSAFDIFRMRHAIVADGIFRNGFDG